MREEKNAAADDGRTIADMNVEGMPWYVPGDENRALHRETVSSEALSLSFLLSVTLCGSVSNL